MDVKNLSVSDFVRYILTGFNFLLLVVVFPLLFLKPGLFSLLLSDLSFGIASLLCISTGYIIDVFKLYKFSPGYKPRLNSFITQISEELGVPFEQAGSYLSLVSKIWGKNSPYDLERRKSEWVFAFDTAASLVISVFVWIASAVYHFYPIRDFGAIWIPILVIIMSIILAVWLYKAGDHEVRRSNQDVLLIMRANKAEILSSWQIKKEQL